MNEDDAPVMIMNPPELSDASVQAVWEFLNELSNAFERHYAVQIRSLLNTQNHLVDQGGDEADEDPF